MTILKATESKLSKIKDNKLNILWIASQKVVTDTINHNKQIISQMSSYDLHDEEHSQKIIEIQEALLRKKISNLSFSE